ncbi:MAG: sugar MFS transporter, partial [Acidobacteriaceae bacterium]|nr:sugar MFS transporter [Acidobacteriaceae bacterium]
MAIVPADQRAVASREGSTDVRAMAIVTTLFFMWGFLTSLNDILVPHLKAIFELNYTQVMLVQFSFFSSYFVFAMPSGKLIELIGYKKSMVTGLVTMGVGGVLFVPAASAPSFALFLGALIVLAAGMTLLQVSANPYVSVLGPERTASSRLNLTQAFNSLGTTIGPYLGGVLILSGTAKTMAQMQQMSAPALEAYRIEQASSVKMPYTLMSAALLLLALAIASLHLPTISTEKGGEGAHRQGSIWKIRHLVLGAVGIFVYVGAEVAIGSFLVNYFSQSYIGNMTEKAATAYVSFYWGGAMVGRFIGAAILQKVPTG